MNKDIKRAWLKNLRSGEYKQATGYLHDPVSGGYCCLGVLCETVKPPQWDGRYYNSPKGARKCVPDIDWMESIGVTLHSQLWNKNDDGYTFAQIADYIEENL